MIMTDELSPLEERIFDTLRQTPDEWLTRNQIAERIGRTNGYTFNDVGALKRLHERGIVEVREKITGVAKKRFEYRITGGTT